MSTLVRTPVPMPAGTHPRPSAPPSPHSVQRVSALDGIRAIAVTAVVLYHFFPLTLPGGYLGVDVFFVLSGFLITSLLLRERDRTGSVSLPDFWKRRARRILPAALTVAALTSALALLADPDLRVSLGRQLFGIATFSTNWVQIAAADSYFARGEPQLFLHYWSLAVEEQFYLFWPLIVVAVASLVGSGTLRRHRAGVALIAATGAVVSALLMGLWFDPDADPSRLYYGTDTHATGLFVGALAAIFTTSTSASRLAATWPSWQRGNILTRPGNVLTIGCLAGVLTAFVWMKDTSPVAYHGGIAAVSAATAILVISAAHNRGVVSYYLSHPAMRWIGLRSYSFYLVHWPAFVLTDDLISDPVSRASGLVPVVALTATILVGSACYRWIEQPFMRREVTRTLRPPLRMVAAFAAVLTALALTGYSVASAPEMSSTQAALEQAQRDQEEAEKSPPPPPPPPPRTMPRGQDITVIGDSVALGASEALMAAFPGMQPHQIDAEVSRSWLAVPPLVAQRVATNTLGEALILGVGANGPAGAEYVEAVLAEVPPGVLVVIVNAYSTQAILPAINDGINQAVANNPHVEMADWYTAVAAHPDYLAADNVHPADTRGRELYAQVAKEALQRLVDRTPATTPPR